MATKLTTPVIVQQKLAAFDQLQPEFEACFQYMQDVHGQQRFSSFSVADVVRYLHARWIGECRGRLLSVPRTIKEFEGKRCLELLRDWQTEEDTASVVSFLHHKLDMLPLADLTRQLHEARLAHVDEGLIKRLLHGRLILLNRGMNLMQILDAIFLLPEEELSQEVRRACEQYGHLVSQIEQQLTDLDSPLYSYIPHQQLAQRNMVVMNKLGKDVLLRPADLPGQRSWRVVTPIEPLSPFAEHVVDSYQEMTSTKYNNPRDAHFLDSPE